MASALSPSCINSRRILRSVITGSVLFRGRLGPIVSLFTVGPRWGTWICQMAFSIPIFTSKMSQFFADAQGPEQAFPNYAFLEPSYFGANQNDQHPPSDVLRGEVLL